MIGFSFIQNNIEYVIVLPSVTYTSGNKVVAGSQELEIYDSTVMASLETAIAAYQPGGGGGGDYSQGYADGEAAKESAIASSQAITANLYKSKLASEDATIAAADSTTLAGQGTIFSEAYQYLNTETDWHCDDPLCFELAEGVPSRTIAINTTSLKGGEISFNKSTWTSIIDNTFHEYTISTSNPILYVRCKMCVHQTYDDSERSAIFPSSDNGGIILSGDLRSLCEANKGEMISNYELDRLFEYNTAIIDASRLKCHNNLISSCYRNMFNGCTSLTAAPALPATSLANYCYQSMFSGCTSLSSAPSLPATTLATSCYSSMFYGCTSLASAPSLPATTLASTCYNNMFSSCTSLVTAPALPATSLANYCYQNMFGGCTSLTAAPALPATSLANYCYQNMFDGCTSLASAPALPATTAATACYSSMFYGCTSLASAPSLPATTLASNCYNNMFSGCTSLTAAPELPATSLANRCYNNMFYSCTSLTSISVGAMSWNTNNSLNWVTNVPSTGTFTKPSGTTIPTGTSGIPSGWNVIDK